ncbi:MAG TPA: hypothetical protein VJC39_03525 [Candidatus Nanoarchaeia archaeon]|nr:hypothetical protein [Candidatus Nanoarchaeia archaeon]
MVESASTSQTGYDLAKLFVWVKGIEGKMNNLLRQTDLVKGDLLKKNKLLIEEVKLLNEELLEVKRQQEKTIQKMDLIIKELKQTAGIEEVETLKKYIGFWNPLNFVTQRDLERTVELKIKDR